MVSMFHHLLLSLSTTIVIFKSHLDVFVHLFLSSLPSRTPNFKLKLSEVLLNTVRQNPNLTQLIQIIIFVNETPIHISQLCSDPNSHQIFHTAVQNNSSVFKTVRKAQNPHNFYFQTCKCTDDTGHSIIN